MPTTRRQQKAVEESPEKTLTRLNRQTTKRLGSQVESQPKKVSRNEKTTQSHELKNELSPYELKRQENIKEIQGFLSSLNILQVRNELKESVRPKTTGKRLLIVQQQEIAPRRSRRLQNKEPGSHEESKLDEPTLDPDKKSGPLPMTPLNVSESQLPEQLLKIWTEKCSQKNQKQRMDSIQYHSALLNMKLMKDNIAKVVKKRILSVAFHPSSSNLIMAAGDTRGQVGLWSLSSTWGNDGLLLFEPHTSAVSCVKFSPANPTDFLSTSYDGSVRLMNVEKAVFDNVYANDYGLKGFDFLSDDGMNFLIGTWSGEIAFVDRRTPGNTHESLHSLDTKTLRSISVHPLQKQYFAVAESSVVNIYDRRFLKKSVCTPVCQLAGHTRSISNALFSPDTGNRILTSCLDQHIRIYDTSTTDDAPLLTSISHNTQSGRWISKVVAVWDPKQEDCFVVGSLSKHPLVNMKVFHESGALLHTFSDWNMTNVLPVLAFHPTRNVLMGGSSSGRLYVFNEFDA